MLQHIIVTTGTAPSLETYKAGMKGCLNTRNYLKAWKLYQLATESSDLQLDGEMVEGALTALTEVRGYPGGKPGAGVRVRQVFGVRERGSD